MKKLYLLSIFMLTFFIGKSQKISYNELTEKYEWAFEITTKTSEPKITFDYIEDWLVSNYPNKSSSLKLNNREKGKIIYTAAFETKIFPSKGLISFNYNIKINNNKVNFLLDNFSYTIIGQATSAGVELNFENKGLALKKKIISETELKIIEVLKKLKF